MVRPEARDAAPLILARLFLWGALLDTTPAGAQSQDNAAADFERHKTEVIATTPLPGIGTPLKQVPANVQISTDRDFRRQRNLDLTDFLDQNAGSISINPGQNNPFQPDLSFRGFLASPLLGTPQGLSVFLDGVRINEPFGDVVNWDLIPKNALASMQLNPGSNPLFGLNTLGGALALYTKSGFGYPGAAVNVEAGAWGRRSVEFEAGNHGDNADIFVAGTSFEERGWRDFSPSRVNQLFAKTGWQDENSDLDVSFIAARTALQGTQSLPRSMLDNPRQAYTWPDITHNELAFVNIQGSHFFTKKWLLSGNLYVRKLRSEFFNSNVNGEFLEQGGQDANAPSAFNDRGLTEQLGSGASAQLSYLGELAGRKNQLTIGAAADRGRINFRQDSQPAEFTDTRGTVGTGDFSTETDVRTYSSNIGLYFADTLELASHWSLALSGRYNRTRVEIADNSGEAPALNGNHTFSRFNPAVGMNFYPSAEQTWYGSYSEGIRAPSPMELTCADPLAPCKLPNNFLADPPLAAVISSTIELGGRGKIAALGWSAALFRTDLKNDIQFISAGGGSANAGYFQNVGKTRRQGIELGLTQQLAAWSWALRYSLIDATYRSAFRLQSVDNSEANTDGEIEVSPGNRIPGVPRHNMKLRMEYDAGAWSAGGNLMAQSRQYARGDENNQDKNGAIPGFVVLNLDAQLELGGGWTLSARINNVLDRKYETFATLGRNFFTGPGGTFDAVNAVPEQFRSSAAPRGIWFGVRWEIGAAGTKKNNVR
jgi:iron complex outermembrane receptor protein